MSSIKLQGATSGEITVTVPSVAGTNTLTLPANTGNIITTGDSGTITQGMIGSNVTSTGPAFSAYASGIQSVANAVYTKVSYSAEEFDTASCYDTSLSRFTPNVEGYYQVSANIVFDGAGSGTETISLLYKNGAVWNWGTDFNFTVGHYYGHTVVSFIYLNGTTDFIEIYFRQSSGVSANVNPSGAFPSRFGAFLARAV